MSADTDAAEQPQTTTEDASEAQPGAEGNAAQAQAEPQPTKQDHEAQALADAQPGGPPPQPPAAPPLDLSAYDLTLIGRVAHDAVASYHAAKGQAVVLFDNADVLAQAHSVLKVAEQLKAIVTFASIHAKSIEEAILTGVAAGFHHFEMQKTLPQGEVVNQQAAPAGEQA